MRVVRFDRFGGPEVLRVVEEPDPVPGPGEAVVRIVAAGVNPADLAMIAGRYGVRPPLPATPGLEAAGVVLAVGAGVKEPCVGERVILALGAARGQGTWRSLVVAPAESLLRTPERLSDDQAGAALLTSLTAVVLMESLGCAEGEAILVTAPRSNTGLALGQLAAVSGLRLYGVARREGAPPPGYQAVTVWPAWPVPAGVPLRAALDAVAGEWTQTCLEAVQPGGEVVVYGMLSGRPCAVDPASLIYGEKRLRGFWLQRWLENAAPTERDAVYALALTYLSAGTLAPVVARTFSLDAVEAACRFALSAGRVGKVVLRP
ncbi:MAG: zinc-dependent alcohol dehydrogenase family protein [Chloroflexota bacterium]|nr:zinc-dependent alcohol dehydrogenase family protein [Dehalococcoidia bacterium]MDW8253503.1 zinc-dependent alcohol dehydrogenase family protein [Chloroflexota bacterium]